MSTTRTDTRMHDVVALRPTHNGSDPSEIGELDKVALLTAAEGWRSGTTGTVVSVFPPFATIEIFGYLGETLDFVDVPIEALRLIRKCLRPDLDFARSRAMEGAHKSTVPPAIGEHDVVALTTAVDGWPMGTIGAVVNDGSTHKLIEISNHLGEALDFLSVRTEHLCLAWKSLRSTAGTDDPESAVD